jgi:hypothetical protein
MPDTQARPLSILSYMDMVRTCAAGIVVVALAWLVHLVLRWMGRRGWIFYGSEPTRPMGVRTAYAMMEFDTLFNPPVEHVIEYRRHGDLWVQQQSGDDGGEGNEGY